MSGRELAQAESDQAMAPDTGQAVALVMFQATEQKMAERAVPARFPVAGRSGAVARAPFQRVAGETLRRESAPRGRHAAAKARWLLKPA